MQNFAVKRTNIELSLQILSVKRERHKSGRSDGPRYDLEKFQKKVLPLKDQFPRNLFLIGKKSGGSRLVINPKQLNGSVPYIHFKIETLDILKDLLLPEDLMCKLDLQSAYFNILFTSILKNVCSDFVEQKYLRVSLPVFKISPAPLKFIKIMKIYISLLRKLNVRKIIFLDGMLLLERTRRKF